MPNVLDAEPMRALARRAASKIKAPRVAARFAQLAFARLLADPNNFRPATPEDLRCAPDWVGNALSRGEEISVFRPNRAASARLHTVARRLAETCALTETDPGACPEDARSIEAARRFLDSIERSSFEVTARKALYYSRIELDRRDSRSREPLCPAQEHPATQGRTWRRITSFAELRAVGREFRNCLAKASSSGAYGAALRTGSGQFWVLRQDNGAGMIVAMAAVAARAHFLEVRGPNNAIIPADNADLARLAAALGMTSPEKPQPPTVPTPPRRTCGAHAFPPSDQDLAELFSLLRRRVA
jgi:hypothetical protein